MILAADTLGPVLGNPLAVGGFVLGALALLAGLLRLQSKPRQDSEQLKQALSMRSAGLPFLAWSAIDGQIRRLLHRLHEDWTAGNLKPLKHLLDEDWRLEQQAWLNRTKAQGRIHRLELKSIESVEPLRFDSGGDDSAPMLWTRLELMRIDEVEGIGKEDPPVRRAVLFARWVFTGDGWRLEALDEDEPAAAAEPSRFDDDALGRHAVTAKLDVLSDAELPSVDDLV